LIDSPTHISTSGDDRTSLVNHAFAFENINKWFATLESPSNPLNRQRIDRLHVRMVMTETNGTEICDYYIGTCSFDASTSEWRGRWPSLVATYVISPDDNMPLLYLDMLLQHPDGEQNGDRDDVKAAIQRIWALLEQNWDEDPRTCQKDISSFVEHMLELGDQQTFRFANGITALCGKLGVSSLVNTRLPSGNTPLTLAVDLGDVDFLRFLLELKADPNDVFVDYHGSSPDGKVLFGPTHVSGTPPLSIALFKVSSPQRDEMIEALLTAGARIDIVNVNGVTPLFVFKYVQARDDVDDRYNETIVRNMQELVAELSSSFR